MDTLTKESAWKAIEGVNHPAINCSLKELGIAKDLTIDEQGIHITMALPFAGVPQSVQQQMAESLVEPLVQFGKPIDFQLVVMNEDEKQRFLYLEQANWKDGQQPQCS